MAIWNTDDDVLKDYLRDRFDDDRYEPDNEGEESLEDIEDREYWRNVLDDELRHNR